LRYIFLYHANISRLRVLLKYSRYYMIVTVEPLLLSYFINIIQPISAVL
jgi:hypothetical protein